MLRSPLQAAREKADVLRECFKLQCVLSGYADQWEAYRAYDAGEQWPEPLELFWQWMNAAQHEFYLLRDGPNGFLGGKGL